MLKVQVEIEGTTPLLCNRFGDLAGEGTSGALVGDKGTPREQAERKLYVGVKGGLMIPQPNVLRCVIDGGLFFKAGKSKVTTQKSSLIPACLDVAGAEMPLKHREPWTVDTRAVCIPSTGGRILCHRPRFEDWRLAWEMTLDTAILTGKLLREIDLVEARYG